jgi:hypothetical protein
MRPKALTAIQKRRLIPTRGTKSCSCRLVNVVVVGIQACLDIVRPVPLAPEERQIGAASDHVA